MPEIELVSLRHAAVQEGAQRLARAGVPEPRRKALRIWKELSESDQPATPERYHAAIERRASGEPLPHVTGWIGFRHLTLRSDARALIPRPETEGLVELLLAKVRAGRVADIGTGSGCIALSLALEGEYSDVIGVDRSRRALAQAAENRALVGARMALVQGDLSEPLRTDAFDALISNPPYLTAAEYASLDCSVRDWEPELALASGEDGLDATARLLADGRRVLRAGGWLALEVDCSRASQAAAAAVQLGWRDVQVHMDLFGRERFLLARRSNTR